MKSIKRNNSLDSLRGLAIFIMIAANSWPYIYPFGTCPYILRILFSTAAPIFIFLSGFSIQLSIESGKSDSNIITRAIQVIFIGAIIDVLVWKIFPFITYDVLYLLGFSSIIIVFLNRTKLGIQIAALALLLLFNLMILDHYQFKLQEIPVFEDNSSIDFREIIRHMALDGWFPLFPWAGIAILGYLASKYRKLFPSFYKYLLAVGTIAVFLFFILILSLNGDNPTLRDGYTELFYPVKDIFWLYLIGLIFLMTHALTKFKLKENYFSRLGETSLSIYLFHTILIKWYLPLFTQSKNNFSWSKMLISLMIFYIIISMFNLFIKHYLKKLKFGKYRILGFLIGV